MCYYFSFLKNIYFWCHILHLQKEKCHRRALVKFSFSLGKFRLQVFGNLFHERLLFYLFSVAADISDKIRLGKQVLGYFVESVDCVFYNFTVIHPNEREVLLNQLRCCKSIQCWATLWWVFISKNSRQFMQFFADLFCKVGWRDNQNLFFYQKEIGNSANKFMDSCH